MLNRLTIVRLVAVVALTAALSPAQAEGVSITLRPRGEGAEVIRKGLGIYSVFRDLRNRAKTDQRGTNNGAAIAQHGRGNNAFVFQRGRDNSGTITQNGNYNSYGLFQFGRRNSTNVVQNGNGDVGITLQGNW
jgi:Curlin associated repeat